MKHPIGKIRYISITFGFFLVLISNITSWQDQIIGLIFGLGYFLFYSYIAGSIITGKKIWRLILGIPLFMAIIASVGATLLYFSLLNQIAIIGLVLFLPAILFLPYYRHREFEYRSLKQIFTEYKEKRDQKNEPWLNWLIAGGYIFLWLIAGVLIIKARTNESLQSPWEIISWPFFSVYFIASALLISYCIKTTRHYLGLLLVNIHAFLSVSIAMIVYAIGFGFDPFIHEAAQKIIFETGKITPVTPYYLGQYAIVVFLKYLTLIDIGLINKILTPVFFSLVIPNTVFYVFSKWLKKNDALIIAIATLVIPYGGFIMSTPQNLANAFFIFTVLMSMLYFKNQLSITTLGLLVIGCTAIHPLAGIPLIIFATISFLFKKFYSIYQHTPFQFFLISLIFIWVMPIIFLVTKIATNITTPTISPRQLFELGVIKNYDFFLNLVYLTKACYPILFILISFVGIIYLYKNKFIKNNTAYLTTAIVLTINFLIAKYFLIFGNLQNHDQSEFVNRLAWLALYSSLPIFFIGFYVIYKKWKERNIFTAGTMVFLLASSITISMYLSYPRVDNYQPSKLYSVSANDISAVKLINQRANAKHVVLANQMVGVTAISQLGFKNYYENEFYYSMPMGLTQKLYTAYLEMIYQGAKKETMRNIITEMKVDEAYFVLNSYWNNSEKILAQAKQSADAFYNINDKVYIFKYSKD